jgi:DNA invertase Pin-like site-specific DNA recombinase
MLKKPIHVALYARVSVSERNVESQLRELRAVADRHGWNVVAVFKDQGISGAKGRDKRPGLDKLLTPRVDLIAALER